MPVHLVDASPYIFRAFHTLPETIRDPEGRPTNAVHGFLDFLLKLIREEDVTHVAVCFDFDLVKSYRQAIFPDYKANRPAPPAPLVSQLGICREAAEAVGARTFVADGYEADDLIATLLKRLRSPAVIVTGDKDLAQLVTDDVTLLDYARDARYGPAEVRDKFGVRPDQVADLLALAGDAVDNVPGVKGVGRKTAANLLQRFAHVEEIDWGGLRGPAAAGRDAALLSKRLTVLAYDAPVSATLEDLRYRGADPAAVDAFLKRLGSERLRARIPLRA
ncbi:MAG TPA: 5'-3' exonuclease H3TH domain-containing protein [Planctomycetota bacterium]|nr:5'-3' exonuclease H3TH domain-containing protein [Planctomycetota bacterium]